MKMLPEKTSTIPHPQSSLRLPLSNLKVPQGSRVPIRGNIPFILIHLSCLFVFATGVSPVALLVFLVTLLPRMFGLTAGYHRYFSHRSFKTSRIFQFVLAILGACSLQRDPMWWAAHHRRHHRYTDTELDSHSPGVQGFFWAHVGWVMHRPYAKIDPTPSVPDLAAYPELRFLHRHQKLPGFLFLLLVLVSGWAIENFAPHWQTSMAQVVVWGFVISTVFLFHATFAVNSFAHVFGNRPYETHDTSRNNVWVALLTMGEGWHNNHHRFPYAEKHGLKWWQIDMTHGILTVLSWLGIVWDLKQPRKDLI
jgi:stearoyl-CoA desaturase (delta-9 desaturase)